MVDAGDGTQEAADQRVELRALQDVRHHGPVPDHRLGAARRRRRARSTKACDALTASRRQRRKAAAIAARRRAASSRRSARTLPLARRRAPSTATRSSRAGQPADPGVLARPHPAGHALLPRPRHRRHHQPELRRRVDRAASSSGSATARRAGRRRAAARARCVQLRREMAAGQPAAFTVDGPRGPARVAQPGAVWLAGATGNPIAAVSHRGAIAFWTAEQLGSRRRSRSRSAPSRWRSASRSTCRATPTRRRSKRSASSSKRVLAALETSARAADAELTRALTHDSCSCC